MACTCSPGYEARMSNLSSICRPAGCTSGGINYSKQLISIKNLTCVKNGVGTPSGTCETLAGCCS